MGFQLFLLIFGGINFSFVNGFSKPLNAFGVQCNVSNQLSLICNSSVQTPYITGALATLSSPSECTSAWNRHKKCGVFAAATAVARKLCEKTLRRIDGKTQCTINTPFLIQMMQNESCLLTTEISRQMMKWSYVCRDNDEILKTMCIDMVLGQREPFAKGSVLSPFFPANYPSGENCSMSISPDAGEVNIRPALLLLKANSECQNFLTIGNIKLCSSHELNPTLLYNLSSPQSIRFETVEEKQWFQTLGGFQLNFQLSNIDDVDNSDGSSSFDKRLLIVCSIVVVCAVLLLLVGLLITCYVSRRKRRLKRKSHRRSYQGTSRLSTIGSNDINIGTNGYCNSIMDIDNDPYETQVPPFDFDRYSERRYQPSIRSDFGSVRQSGISLTKPKSVNGRSFRTYAVANPPSYRSNSRFLSSEIYSN